MVVNLIEAPEKSRGVRHRCPKRRDTVLAGLHNVIIDEIGRLFVCSAQRPQADRRHWTWVVGCVIITTIIIAARPPFSSRPLFQHITPAASHLSHQSKASRAFIVLTASPAHTRTLVTKQKARESRPAQRTDRVHSWELSHMKRLDCRVRVIGMHTYSAAVQC